MTSRPIMVDAVLDGVLTTRLASRCGISTPKVGTATQLSNPSGKWYLEENRGSVEDLFAWLDVSGGDRVVTLILFQLYVLSRSYFYPYS